MVTRRTAIKLGVVGALAPRFLFARTTEAWNFAVFSDTHYGISGHVEKNDVLLREIATHNPAFAVDAGDLTERAWPFEFDQASNALSQLPYKVHVTPGNHDVRWAPRGPMMFEQRIGPMRQLFRHRGCAFLLLDSTVPLSHFGHIGGPQARWIAQTLSGLDRNTPLFVFMHHPVGRPAGIDDEARLASVLEPFNTKVMFTAHGHADLVWDWNGVTATMSKGLYQGSYQIATLDDDAGVLRLSRRTAESPTPTPFAEIPLARRGGVRPTSAAPVQNTANGVVREVWRRPLGGGVMSELVVDGDAVLVSCMDGALYRFDKRSGALQWKAATDGFIHSTPAVVGRNIVVGSADGFVYAFARHTGKLAWRAQTQGAVYASAAHAQGVVAIASGDGSIYGLDPRTGATRWRFELEEGPSSFAQSPAATDGRQFFVGAWNQNIYALDAKTGKANWRYRASERGFYFSAAIARPVVHDKRIYIPSNDNTLHAIDARTGANVWKRSAPEDKFGYSSPLIANGRIYIGSLGDKGQVHCLDAKSGESIWMTATGSTIYESSPVLARGFIAIGSVNGLLSVLRARDGAIVGSYRFPPGLFLSTPAASGDAFYAATFAEEVVAVRVK